jgi:RNA polymerase sigma-32 factor
MSDRDPSPDQGQQQAPGQGSGGQDPEGQEPEVEVLAGDEQSPSLEDDEELDLDQDEDSDDGGAVDGGETAGRPAGAKSTKLAPAPSRSVARYDPLQAYINSIRQYGLLSVEDEHELAVRYRETGDLEAARRLVTANLRLVVKIAHEYRKAYRNLLDLVQEGNIGLMHAVKKFDPYRGVKLSSYAAWWIRAYILKFILNNWRLVKIGTTQVQRKLFFNLKKEVERLQAMGIEHPGPRLLAERLDVPEDEVTSMQRRLAGSDVSLDAPLKSDEGGGATRLDFVADVAEGPDKTVEDQQFSERLQQKLRQFGRTLSGRDKEIFELRTVADEPMTLQEIGDMYGITRERARQIERRMMDRLRDFLREELGDAVDVALGIGE